MKETSPSTRSNETEEGHKMIPNLAKAAMGVGAKAAHLSYEVGRVSSKVNDSVAETIDDGVYAAKRAAKQSIRAAEELTDETAYRIKQHPFRAVGITLGVGFGVGAVVGLVASYLRKTRSS